MKQIKKILCMLLLMLSIISIKSQSSLLPINHCLGTCSQCTPNDLSTCSGVQLIDCIPGYTGSNCTIKPTFASQLILMSQSERKPTLPWKDNKIISCTYNTTTNKQTKINILGLYTLLTDNQITFDIQPYYQNFILSFNLIRGNWTPFSDRLKILITDQYSTIIHSQFIQLSQKDNNNSTQYPLICNNNNQHYIVQKYQISSTFKPDINKKITISFQGMIFSGAQWGITNVRLAVGCSNFLVHDGLDCQKCLDGYFPLKSTNNTVIGCKECPLNCTSCTDLLTCTACDPGFTLQQGKCINNNIFIVLGISNQTTFCQNQPFFLSSTSGPQQKLQIIINPLPPHLNQTRLQFYLAYTPSDFQSTDVISIQVDGKQIDQILGTYLNSIGMKPKSICNNFGTKGYYSLYKFISPYFNHNLTTINLTLTVNNPRKIGIHEIGIQYQPNIIINQIISSQTQSSSFVSPIIPQLNNSSNKKSIIIIPQATASVIMGSTTELSSTTIQIQTNNTQLTDKILMESNDSIDDHQSSQIRNSIEELQKVIEKVQFGVKSSQQLTITIHYPLQLQKLPYISANFTKTNMQLIPEVSTQTNNYQQLVFNLDISLLNQQIQLYMHDSKQSQLSTRILQTNVDPIYLGSVQVIRHDYLTPQQLDRLNKFAGFFQAMAWIAILSTFLLSIFSNSVITQKFILLLQIIFLHMYIHTEYLPASFKFVVGHGLQRIQTLNYFSSSLANFIEKLLLGNVIQQSPMRFTTFIKDINFTRAVYPSIIALLVYLIVFGVLNIIHKIIQPSMQSTEGNYEHNKFDIIKQFISSTSERFHNFWHQVWQYLFITFTFAGLLQLYNLSYPIGSNRSAIPNDIFCFICIVGFITLPIITYLYLNVKYEEMDYSDYAYWNQNILFQKLPSSTLPSHHHRILIIISNARYFLLATSFAFISIYPITSLATIIIINILSLFYLVYTKVQIDRILSILDIIEHSLLIFFSFLIAITYILSFSLSTSKYMILGYLLSVICLLLSIVGLARACWNVFCKIKDEESQKQDTAFKPTSPTQRIN